jgi:hypothetical protein
MKFKLILFFTGFYFFVHGQGRRDFLNLSADSTSIYIQLPSIGAQFYSSAFAPEKFIFNRDKETVIDFQNALDNLDEYNDHIAQIDINSIGVTLQFNDLLLVAGHHAKYIGSLQYPKELAELATLGNANFIGQTVEVGPSFHYIHYHEIYLGGSVRIGKIRIGGKLKILSGNEFLSTDDNHMSLSTSSDVFNLSLDNNYDIYSSSILSYNRINDLDTDFDPGVYNAFFQQNQGLAVDLGVSWEATEKLNIQAKLLDYGKIKWDRKTNHYFKEGITTYDGINLLDYLSDEGNISIKDSLYGLLDLDNESDLTFSRNTPYTWQVSGLYQLTEKGEFSALFGQTNFQTNRITYWQMRYTHQLNKVLVLHNIITGFGKSQLNFGVGIELNAGPIVINASSANIIGLANLLSTRYNNLAFGIGLKF